MRALRWRCASFDIDLHEPAIMGIVNVTPDSFSDGGEHASAFDAIDHAMALVAEGATIIDVGGESTRPGAEEVSVDVELLRVLPVVSFLAKKGVCVSIDTRHASVAKECVEKGASIINDVTGFKDPKMREVASGCDAGLVIMHMAGDPKTMQDDPHYDDVVGEVEQELLNAARLLERSGVARDRICLDAGVGFGKTHVHNQKLVQATARFADLGYPVMSAVSRKSFIGAMSREDVPSRRDRASALCSAFMAGQGARVLRVHDVASTREMLQESHRAIIALGSNMGDRCKHIDDALDALRRDPDIWVGAVSSYVESEPAYMEAQDDFVNAVAVLQTTLDPYRLLDVLHGVEDEHARVRTVPNGPRTLDLDIIDYEGVVQDACDLALPHPKALERDFVVTPLLEVMPGCVLSDGTAVAFDSVRVGKVSGMAR